MKTFKFAIVVLVSLFTATGTFGSTQSQDLVTAGKTALFANGVTFNGMVAADALFQQAVAADNTDEAANFFAGFTRVLAFHLVAGSGNGIDSLRELLEGFGFTRNDSVQSVGQGEPYYPTVINEEMVLLKDSPAGGELRDFLAGPFVTMLDSSIANFNAIANDSEFILTAAETGNDQDSVIDYGDVLFLKFLLQSWKAMLQTVSSYDLGIDLDELFGANDSFDVRKDLFDTYENFLRVYNNDSSLPTEAGDTLLAAIETYMAAIAFIKAESDDQADDMITISPQDYADEREFTNLLKTIRQSLVDGKPAKFGEIGIGWDLTNDLGQDIRMNLSYSYDKEFLGGEYFGTNGCDFLWCQGEIVSFAVNDSTSRVTITTSQGGDGCGLEAVLTGIMGDNDAVINGSYTATPACDSGWSGTFSGTLDGIEYYGEAISFYALYHHPLDIRSKLPRMAHDPYTGELFSDRLPDRTLSGVFPRGFESNDPGIEKFVFASSNMSSGEITRAYIYPQGLAPWEIARISVAGSDGWYFEIDSGLESYLLYSSHRTGTRYMLNLPGTLSNGIYTVTIEDVYGNYHQESKQFTRNTLPIVTNNMTPVNGDHVGTTTPTMSWDPVAGNDTWYTLQIMDWNRKTTVYMSAWSQDSSITVPAGFLKADIGYKWNVIASESDVGGATNNMSFSNWQNFNTGGSSEALAIAGQQVYSHGRTGAQRTRFALNVKGASPNQITSITVTDPDANDYAILPEHYNQDFGYIFTYNGVLADGTYTFTVIDQNATTVQATAVLAYNALPVPGPISPAPESWVMTITPTMTWQPVTDDLADTLYYRIAVFDLLGNRLYWSARVNDNKIMVPPGVLRLNSPYAWQVEVFDNDSGAVIKNRTDSDRMPFFVAGEVPPVAISGNLDANSGLTGYNDSWPLFVNAYDGDEPGSHLLSAGMIADSGPYTLYNIPSYTPVWLEAHWDKDNDSQYSNGDWVGHAAGPVQFADQQAAQNFSADLLLTRELSGIIPAMPYSDGNAFPGNYFLYVANEGNSGGGGTTISRLSPTGDGVVVGRNFFGPSGLAVHPVSGDLYVSDDDQPGIYIVSLADGSLTMFNDSLDILGNPNGLAFDGQNRLLVADAGDAVRRIDLADNSITTLAEGFGVPQAVAAYGTEVFFTAWDGYIYRILANDSLPITFPAETNRYTANPVVANTQGGMVIDGNGNIYVADYSGQVVRVNDSGTVETVFSLPGVLTRGLALSPAEDTLLVTSFGADAIYEVDLATGTITILADSATTGYGWGVLGGPFGMVLTTNSYPDFGKPGDNDSDGVPDDQDAFPHDPTEWQDTDHDSIGDNSDADDDNDGYADSIDLFPLDNSEWFDNDHDGIGDNSDPDDDNDGINDDVPDNCPYVWNQGQEDSDQDGLGDACDGFLHTIYAGWNLIALTEPLPGGYMASDLLRDINTSGGDVTKIMTWDGSAWQTYHEDAPFGDFVIEQGQGYFLFAEEEAVWLERLNGD